MDTLAAWYPVLVVGGVQCAAFLLMGPKSKVCRALLAWLSMACIGRYLFWRVLYTAPLHQNLGQRIWSHLFIGTEVLSGMSTMLVLFFLSRTMDRSGVADARRNSDLLDAAVDVLIVTYNESKEIVERTLAGALAIDHRDLRIWLLDDGSRPWARELAASLGVQYTCRYKGKHAKAGNINEGMKVVLAEGRRPEFLLLLDADFVANAKILRRTLGLMEEDDVGIVQTPQHFFNHDPVQQNLLCAGVWPDEQRFFFNVLMPSRDAWGTAFCCGTSALLRVKAFEAAGGFAIETVTEDALTSLKFKEHGYRTIFLNEALSLGLAPESLQEYVAQRSRWCLGAVQQLFTRYSFTGNARVSGMDRLAFFDTILYWISGAMFKIMMWMAPAVFWLTGTSVLRSDSAGMVEWLLPALVANLLFMRFYAGNRVMPIMTDVSQLLSATTICRTVLHGLLRPFGQPFKVTAKGISTTKITVHWNLLWPFAMIALCTLLGLCMHLSGFSPDEDAQGFKLNVIWSVLGVAVQGLAIIACIEPAKRRLNDRYETQEETILRYARPDSRTAEEEEEVAGTVIELSLGGARITRAEGWIDSARKGTLVLDHGRLQIRFELVRQLNETTIAIRFNATPTENRALMVKLYGDGRYHREVEEISMLATFHRLALTLLT